VRIHFPRPRPYQIPVLTSGVTDDVTVSAPQLGKTWTAAEWLWIKALKHGADPKGRVWWWTAPTFPQCQHAIRHMVEWARNAGVLERATATPPMELVFVNGGIIQARSWERPENMYGPTVLGGVSDEFGELTDRAYSAISSRRAETIADGFGMWRWIGNVGTIGGPAENLWKLAESGAPGFACRRWRWRDRAEAHECGCGNGAPVPIELGMSKRHIPKCPRGIYVGFIEREAERMGGSQFRRLYEAEWEDWNTLPVYTFDRAVHTKDIELDPHLPLEVSCDFNVDPMCWAVGQHKGDEAWVSDEIVIEGSATTADACNELIRRYPTPKRDVVVFGDASGKARSTKSNRSDYDTIQEILGGYYRQVRLEVPSANPPVTERVNAYNGRLRSASGAVRYWLHSRCTWGADDLARTSWRQGTRDIEKTRDRRRTHWTDAEGYRLHRLYPVSVDAPVTVHRPPVQREAPFADMRF
jgi:hypothetical protein